MKTLQDILKTAYLNTFGGHKPENMPFESLQEFMVMYMEDISPEQLELYKNELTGYYQSVDLGVILWLAHAESRHGKTNLQILPNPDGLIPRALNYN